MTRTRHLTRSAVVAAASALFAVAGAGTAALAFSEGSIVEAPATSTAAVSAASAAYAAPAPTAVELAAPAKAHEAARVELARTAAEAKAAAAAAAEAAAARKAAAKAAAAKAAAKKAAARKAAAKQAAAARAVSSTQKASAGTRSSGKTIYIRSYSNGGGQAAIDRCKLVLWYTSPLWLAAHNYCGYQWMAYVATGTKVVVTQGAAAGTYKVTSHMRLSRQGGSMPRVNADLVLQTCVGSGTGLTLLQRV